jgi:hypothetical protein
MNILIIILLVIFLALKVFELFFKTESPHVVLNEKISLVNEYIRKEVSFEILRWILGERFQRSPVTGDPVFVKQMTDAEEIKKKTAVITNIIAEKMSSKLRAVFNTFYKKELESIGKRKFIDIALREYIGRYVFFMFRRLSYDITIMINSDSNTSKKLDDILNIYIVSLEKTVYLDNDIYLIGREQINGE